MRLWTLHPKYLDALGLVALWREGLLAQAVLRGLTVGYTNHPQLTRFKESRAPLASIRSYLAAVHDEAAGRGYRFDRRKVAGRTDSDQLIATTGQVAYEWRHLKAKLAVRDRARLASLRGIGQPDPHPLFRIVPGPVERWEAVRGRRRTMTLTKLSQLIPAVRRTADRGKHG
ncbi:MAG TPA: pyrimidine dimer DNA glycosylase/endonuclease V [Vicinamibacteria bacterium]|nr:pyrimidine dimer DNA glycosylase/endonuclease V [Vicinamibacteria bacterium]